MGLIYLLPIKRKSFCFSSVNRVRRKRLEITFTRISSVLINGEYSNVCGPGSSIGIATDLDGPGSHPDGDEIFRPSIPALAPNLSPVKWIPGLSRG